MELEPAVWEAQTVGIMVPMLLVLNMEQEVAVLVLLLNRQEVEKVRQV